MVVFDRIKAFIGFGAEEAATLRTLAPLFAAHGAAVTDGFYVKLAADPEQAALIAGRVEGLKKTHARWLAELFAGEYGEAYFRGRWQIGLTHVRVGVRPWWVESVTSYLRSEGISLLTAQIEDPDLRVRASQALIKILDIDLMIINLAYADDRLERLVGFTGMSRKLIERCVSQGKG